MAGPALKGEALAEEGADGTRDAGFSFPVFQTILPWRHRPLGPELLAGVLLAAIAIPEQIATARLAGMPATAGLAAFIVGSLAIAVFGSTGPLSVGADSTIAPVIAASVSSIALTSSPTYRADASLLALLVGLIVMVIGLARMAWIADILSAPVVTGFLAGVGIAIVLRQIPVVLGLTPPTGHGPVETTWLTLRAIGRANGWTVAIAATVLVVVGVAEKVSRRFPGAIVALIASAAVVASSDLKAHGVAVLGFVPSGLPHIAAPASSFGALRALLLPALAISLVVLAQSAATVRGLGDARVGRDAGSTATSSGSAPARSSPGSPARSPSTPVRRAPRSWRRPRGRTQLAGLSAAALVLLLVAFAASWLDDVPHATLGAILALIGVRLVRVPELRAILRFDRIEFVLAAVTMLVVALVDVKIGMGLAVTLAVLDRTRRTARPRDAVLGRLPGSSNWVLPSTGLELERLPGIVVYFLEAPMWFANADHVTARIRALVAPGTGVDSFVLDAAAISDVDYTAGRQLTGLARDLAARPRARSASPGRRRSSRPSCGASGSPAWSAGTTSSRLSRRPSRRSSRTTRGRARPVRRCRRVVRRRPSAPVARPCRLESAMINVFLLDDHEVVRAGLRDLLENADENIAVVGEASTASEALTRIAATHPDVAILDVRLGEGETDGIAVCREIRSAHPEIACLMLTSFADDEACAAIMAGAAGYLLKEVRGRDIVGSVKRAARGESLIDPALTQKLIDRMRTGGPEDDRLARLTTRERRVLDLVAEGKTNREIGAELYLAEKTVKNYVSNILVQAGYAAAHRGGGLRGAPRRQRAPVALAGGADRRRAVRLLRRQRPLERLPALLQHGEVLAQPVQRARRVEPLDDDELAGEEGALEALAGGFGEERLGGEGVPVVAEAVLDRRRRRREVGGALAEHPGGEFGGVAELLGADPQGVQVGLGR